MLRSTGRSLAWLVAGGPTAALLLCLMLSTPGCPVCAAEEASPGKGQLAADVKPASDGKPATDDKPEQRPPIRHRVSGLFSPDRAQDLQDVMQRLPEIRLLKIDYETAEASFDYDPEAVFPRAKPEQIIERFDTLLKRESNQTFGIRPLCTVPREKLQRVEIAILGLDCKACSYGAWLAVASLEGVERTTSSFREGRIVAWIDPEKTERATLEEALKKKGVALDGE